MVDQIPLTGFFCVCRFSILQTHPKDPRKSGGGGGCPSCSVKFKEHWNKLLCRSCIDKLACKESAGICKNLISGVKKEMSAIKSMFSGLKALNQPAEVPLVSTPEEGDETGEEDPDSLEELSEAASSKDALVKERKRSWTTAHQRRHLY